MKLRKIAAQYFRLLFAPACIAALTATATQQATAQENPELARIIKDCRDAVSRLGYVRYTVEGFKQDANMPMVELTWQEEGEKYRYTFMQRTDDGSLHFKCTTSFDGVESLRTLFDDGRFFKKHGTWDLPPWVQLMEFITAPFEFLTQRKDVSVWKHPNIVLLQSAGMWEWLAKNAAVTGHQKYKDRDCIVVQVNNTFDRTRVGLTTHYVVYFDAGTCTPIAWKQFDQQGHLISELDVVTEQTVRLTQTDSYTAPRQIKESYYDFGGPTDALLQYWHYDFSDISTDPATGEGFSLDKAIARFIHDDDLNKWVTVQK